MLLSYCYGHFWVKVRLPKFWADLFTAAQRAKSLAGIQEENIVVMHYDDIAWAPQNPFPGVVINTPGGENVYEGVPKVSTTDGYRTTGEQSL